MLAATPQYISVSRRTDIPRFFLEEFFAARQAGAITYDGGYGRSYTVSLLPENVAGYIFWSKDFSHLVRHTRFKMLLATNNAVFHYTINDCPLLEPRVAPLATRLTALKRLCDMVGPERVLWRFDPICKFQNRSGAIATNFDAFFRILPHMEKSGVTRCYFSFMTLYPKLQGRGLCFMDFSNAEKREITEKLQAATEQAGIELYNCCNQELQRIVPAIKKARCVDVDLLERTDRFGIHPRLQPQPTRPGCGCFRSRDIGSYSQQCRHSCLYCYANPCSSSPEDNGAG